MKNEILIRNGFIPLAPARAGGTPQASRRFLATVYSNLLYYGFAPNKEAYRRLECMTDKQLSDWYSNFEKDLRTVTGASKEIGKYIVYKNFPKEVLDMNESDYWINQICLYLGLLKKEDVAEKEKSRGVKIENLPVKVLAPQNADTLQNILDSLLGMGNRWTKEQSAWVNHLIFKENLRGDMEGIPFKENLVALLTEFYKAKKAVKFKVSPMDVLRFAAGLSGAPVDLKTKFKFRNFKRAERRFLAGLLESHGWEKLSENFAANKELWKRLLERLHAKDFNMLEVDAAYNLLYNKECHSNASWVEYYIQNKDLRVFDVLRSGDFMRRLKHLYSIYGLNAFQCFVTNAFPDLTTLQLLKVRRQFDWHNYQYTRMFAPKGNWAKVKIEQNTQEIKDKDIRFLIDSIDNELARRLKDLGPVKLDSNADYVKLQTNDSDMLPYGRGTVFPIPENITFLRSASYWSTKNGWCWMDNGWNFFDENWNSVSSCCWISPKTYGSYAVFSGDPVPSGEMANKSGQMIDIYLDKLSKAGIRYAVWNVLSYNNKKFDDIEEVYTALQWGESPQANNVFEPSRAILNAPLKGQTKSKYVAMIDAKERKLIWLDVSLKANVSNAGSNGENLSKVMPAYMEYLDRLPSVADLFLNAKEYKGASLDRPPATRAKNFIYVGYHDDNVKLNGQEAYVFRPNNEENSFKPLDINKILNSK